MIIKIFEALAEDDYSTVINVDLNGKDQEQWESDLDEFLQENLQENGVYELDPWDEDVCFIQVGDDPSDSTPQEIQENFDTVVNEVKKYLNI